MHTVSYLKVILLVFLVVLSGCEQLAPVNKEVRSGGSVIIDSGNTDGVTLLDISDLSAEITLDNDPNATVYQANIVRLFRAYPDPLSTAARNYSIQSMPPPPVNAGRWMSVVQLISSATGEALPFPSIAVPGPARLVIKKQGVIRSTALLNIIEGETTPNSQWSGTTSGLGFRLSPNPHAVIRISNVDGRNFAGARFVVSYDASTWTNLKDSVLKDTGQSMIRVTKAVQEPYINLSVHEETQGSANKITILFGNPKGFQFWQISALGRYYLEDGKSHARDISTIVLSWFAANALTPLNFDSKMQIIEKEFYDNDGNTISGADAHLELLKL